MTALHFTLLFHQRFHMPAYPDSEKVVCHPCMLINQPSINCSTVSSILLVSQHVAQQAVGFGSLSCSYSIDVPYHEVLYV